MVQVFQFQVYTATWLIPACLSCRLDVPVKYIHQQQITHVSKTITTRTQRNLPFQTCLRNALCAAISFWRNLRDGRTNEQSPEQTQEYPGILDEYSQRNSRYMNLYIIDYTWRHVAKGSGLTLWGSQTLSTALSSGWSFWSLLLNTMRANMRATHTQCKLSRIMA